jgi:hypothetical protein
MKYFFRSLILAGWLISFIATAQEAGWINHFNEQPENYQLKRGEQSLPVVLLQILQVGDVIEVKDKQGVVTLNLAGGTESFKVTAENSPFQVEASHQVPASSESQWTWLKEQLTRWHQLTNPVDSKSDESTMLSMPLLANVKQPAVLAAGQRVLYLQWHGGKPPYQVQVKQRREQLWEVTTEKTQVKTTPINFEAKSSYRVIITDADKNLFLGGFRVIDANEVPNDSTLSKSHQETDEVYQTLFATWLAFQEKGKWRFEAFQRAAHISHSVAKLLRQALAKGEEKQAHRGFSR